MKEPPNYARYIRVADLREQGLTWREVAARVGLSLARVQDIYKKLHRIEYGFAQTESMLIKPLRSIVNHA